jgi:putative tricarboxylic transport membrane protein
MNNPKTMRPVYQIVASVIFFAGLLLVRGSLDLRYYTSMGPGPGFFPFWLSVILTVLAVAMFLKTTFTKSPDEAPSNLFPDLGGVLRIVTVPMALGSVALLLERVGFGPAMFVMNIFVLFTLTKRHFLLVLSIALVGSFGVEYFFIHWLNVPLPKTDFAAFCPQFVCGG